MLRSSDGSVATVPFRSVNPAFGCPIALLPRCPKCGAGVTGSAARGACGISPFSISEIPELTPARWEARRCPIEEAHSDAVHGAEGSRPFLAVFGGLPELKDVPAWISSTVTKTPSVPYWLEALSGSRHRQPTNRARAEIPFGALHCVVRCVRPGAIDGNAELHQVVTYSGL